MPHKACGEVFRNPCALTLGDEPLTGAVEHGPVQLWVASAQVGVALDDAIHAEVWKEPVSLPI